MYETYTIDTRFGLSENDNQFCETLTQALAQTQHANDVYRMDYPTDFPFARFCIRPYTQET